MDVKLVLFSDIMNKLSEEEFLEMKNDIKDHFQDELKTMSNYTNYLKHLKSIKENETTLLIDLFHEFGTVLRGQP